MPKPKTNSPAIAGSSPVPCSPSSYVRYGPEWEAELMTLPKKFLIGMLRKELITIRDDGKAAYVLEPVEVECKHDKGHELNGVGMWICLGCRADITPENAEL